jgi:hypothetical protein
VINITRCVGYQPHVPGTGCYDANAFTASQRRLTTALSILIPSNARAHVSACPRS